MKKEILINPDHIYTKSEYAKTYNISRVTVDRRILDKTLKSLKVKGTTLIIAN